MTFSKIVVGVDDGELVKLDPPAILRPQRNASGDKLGARLPTARWADVRVFALYYEREKDHSRDFNLERERDHVRDVSKRTPPFARAARRA